MRLDPDAYHPLDVGLDRHIADDRRDGGPFAPASAGDAVEQLGAARRQHEIGSRPGERNCETLPQAIRRTGDQNRLTAEIEHASPPVGSVQPVERVYTPSSSATPPKNVSRVLVVEGRQLALAQRDRVARTLDVRVVAGEAQDLGRDRGPQDGLDRMQRGERRHPHLAPQVLDRCQRQRVRLAEHEVARAVLVVDEHLRLSTDRCRPTRLTRWGSQSTPTSSTTTVSFG